MRSTAGIVALLIAVSAPPPPTQHDGLTVVVRADSTTLAMGDRVILHVSLAFDSTRAGASTRILNVQAGRCELAFLNDETGQSYQRRPYDTGMPRVGYPGSLVRLRHGHDLPLDDLIVHLLADNGDQIPPGKYAVRVVYSNDGDYMETYLDSTHQYHHRLRAYDGSGNIWAGRVESQPIALTIVDVSEKATTIAIPKTLKISTTEIEGQIGWRPATDDSTISVMARSGFALGNRWELHTVVDGDTISRFPRGLGLPPDDGGWSFLPPDVSARIQSAKRAQLILYMEVFESSIQPGHMWMPERGVFQVLWQGQASYLFRN